MYVPGFRSLFWFPGYVIEDVHVGGNGLGQITLRWDKRYALRCPRCQAPMKLKRSKTQTAWDLPLGTVIGMLIVYAARQGYCAHCGRHATIHPPGIDPFARATLRLMRFASRLCRYMPLEHVAQLLPVSPATVYRWDKKILLRDLPQPNLDDLGLLLIDEKAVRKRHGYVTLVMNAITGELLHMAEGKKKESLKSFFHKLSPKQKKRIVAVGMDRAGAYYETVREELPHADIVFDKFHLIQNYHGVIDEVRRREWHRAKRQDRTLIKGQRYNLFSAWTKLTPERQQALKELLRLNENLSKVYVLKDALKRLWTYRKRGWAEKYLHRWVQWAMEAGLDALTQFAKGVLKAKDEILNYCRYPLTCGPLEAFNNVISRILHRACGIRNLDYLFLKLRQESLDPAPPK